jgi:transcriptional regulator with XRE-family HTH domain
MPRRRKEPDPTALAFGKAVRQQRQAKGDTLEEVAGKIPVVTPRRDGKGPPTMDPKYLGELEAGWFSPSITTAKLIADALGVPLSDLVRDL